MQLEKSSLIKYCLQNPELKRLKIYLGESLKLTHLILEMQTQPTLPETSALGKLENQAKKKKRGKRHFIINLKRKTRRSLSVSFYVCLGVSLSLDNIAEVNL